MHTAKTSATVQPNRVPCSCPDVEHQRRARRRTRPGPTASPARRRSGCWRRASGRGRRRARRTRPRRRSTPTHSSNRPASAKYTPDSPAQSASTVTAFGSSRTPGGQPGTGQPLGARGSSPSTVSPPIVRWPPTPTVDARRKVGVHPGPEPDQPVGLARRDLVAGPTSQTMRRATSPAICTTPTRTPAVVSISTALRSLSSLALSRSAERNGAGPVLHGHHPPLDRHRAARARPGPTGTR